MSDKIEIIIGTYDGFLLGYKFDVKNEKSSLTQSFADKSHSVSIRCIAVHERWVATGGADDRIFIYDMGTRKQSQILLPHEGTVNCLAFTPDGTHLLSGSEDGRMIATRLKTWFTDATWRKAHNGSSVTHISCHPSGKLALSLGSDLVLRTWNLVKGRVAYKTNLKSRNTLGSLPDCLAWSPSGDFFTLTGQHLVEFWSIKTAEIVRTHKTKSKPACLTWISKDTCLVGLEDGKILWLTTESEEVKEIAAHNTRVKAMYAFNKNLASASSSGEIKLWQIVENKRNLKEVAVTNICCRPTCISILDLQQFGGNYVIGSSLGTKENDKKKCAKTTVPQRGIVKIEYHDDDEEIDTKEEENEEAEDSDDFERNLEEESADDDNSSDEGDESDEDITAEDDYDDDERHSEEENVDDDKSSEGGSENSDLEQETRLTKSRKHKLHIVAPQEHEDKRQKLDNKGKQKFINKSHLQQKKRKQKFKK